MKAILAIARRELEQYFATPLGWIVLTAFLAVTGFFFAFALFEFQEVSIQAQASPYGDGGPTVNDWLLPAIFSNWAIILLLVAPAVTMRLFSEDMRQRSLELLLSSPLSSGQIVLGKFAGVVGFLLVVFALTTYQVAVLMWLGSPDPGIVATSYLAMFLLAVIFAAVGLLASALTDNQLVAFMVAFAGLLILFVFGWFQGEEGLQGALGAMSMLGHVEELLKGLVHIDDLVYFATATALLLFVTQQRIESLRWAGGMGGSSASAADTLSDVAAGVGLVALISVGVRVALQGSAGLADGMGDRIWLGLGLLGVVAGLGWGYRNRAALAEGLASRGTRLLVGSLVLVSLAVGLTVAANILAVRYDERWDATASERYALSAQTLQVLDGLTEDVEVLAFFDRGRLEEDQFRTLAEGYADRSARLRLRFVDPQVDPLMAQANEVTHGYGTVVLKRGTETQKLTTAFDEEALTNALIRVTSDRSHTVCVTRGHEELDPSDVQTTVGLGAAMSRLQDLNYTVQDVVLAREGGVPAACDVVLVPGPQTDLLAVEREQLAAFVVGGGKLFVLLDPIHAPETAADLARYGIAVGDDLVLEQSPTYQVAGGDISYLFLDPDSFDLHPITEPMDGGALLRIVRSVGAGPEVPGVDVQVLARTTVHGWAETRYTDVANIAPDAGEDLLGPVPVMAAAEIRDPSALAVGPRVPGAGAPLVGAAGLEAGASAPEAAPVEGPSDVAGAPAAGGAPPVPRAAGGRVVVVGDTDFAANELVDQVQNQDLFLNTLAWLVGEEQQVSIRQSEASRGTLEMNALQFLLVALISLLFVPGASLVAAVVTWRRRRGR